MNISVQKLLGKIEKELIEAKNSSADARMRERVHAIKSLCELILDEPEAAMPSAGVMKHTYNPPVAQPVQPPSIQQPKRMQMDDDANGDSLFDF